MQLSDYLNQQGETAAAFSRRAGIDSPMLSRLLNGKRLPSARTLYLIGKATHGAVGVNDFVSESTAADP